VNSHGHASPPGDLAHHQRDVLVAQPRVGGRVLPSEHVKVEDAEPGRQRGVRENLELGTLAIARGVMLELARHCGLTVAAGRLSSPRRPKDGARIEIGQARTRAARVRTPVRQTAMMACSRTALGGRLEPPFSAKST